MTVDTYPATNVPYSGKVMHARLKPLGHRFQYRVYALLMDLDHISQVTRSPVFSYNRFHLLSFYDKDHGPRDGTSLRVYVERLLQEAGEHRTHSVQLLCYPRIFGWVFNPLSVYYCRDRSGELTAIIYEVRNTFGEHHTYVAPIRNGELRDGLVRQERDKLFYVSPFIKMDMRYRFRLNSPDGKLTLRILECDAEGPLLSATFSGERLALNTRTLLRAFVQMPLQTLKIVGAIHWEALKLWVKGAKFYHRPKHTKIISYGDQQTSSDV